MAGTAEGGKKAAAKNIANNPHFYADIGRIGGKNGTEGGFAYSKAHGLTLHIEAGRKGGKLSKPYSKNPRTKAYDE